MARTITASSTTEKNKSAGASPRLIVKIAFGGAVGDVYFSDEDLSSPVTATGRIVDAGGLDMRLSARGVQAVGDIQLTLADADGTLLGYLKDVVWILKKVTVYRWFGGTAESDMVTLLSGYVDGSPAWRDSDGTVRIDVTDVTTGYDVTVGRTAHADDFEYVAEEYEGEPLPVVFGRVPDVKCVQVQGGLSGSLAADFGVSDTVAVIDNGEYFPQGEEVTVVICGERITGTFEGRRFTVAERNVAVYSGVTTDNTSNNAYAVYDRNQPDRDNLWSGMWLFVESYAQVKIEASVGATGRMELQSPVTSDGAFNPIIIHTGNSYEIKGENYPNWYSAGNAVHLESADGVYYIANDARSVKVHSVKAMKRRDVTVGVDNTSSEEYLADIPEDLYSVNLNDTTTFPALGRTVTTIRFNQPLKTILDGDWAADEIWAEVSGYTRDGTEMVQNPSDVIKWILVDYGGVDEARIDATTFAAAKTSLTNRRFAFVLREEKDLRDLVADLAFQGQCHLMVLGDDWHLYYLDDNPGSSAASFADSPGGGDLGHERDSVTRSWTGLSDIWSEVSAKYAPDYSGRREAEENRFTLSDSTAEDLFGRRVGEELDFWAYRDVNQAKATAQYYLNHHSRTWETVKLTAYLDALQVIPLDWVTIGNMNAGNWWLSGQKGKVERTEDRSGGEGDADRIPLELWLPIHPGCPTTCQVACQVGGCEGSAEHDCADACETSCVGPCETGCQENCEIICVAACQFGCVNACQQACQNACQGACQEDCELGSCEAGCESSCETGEEDSCGSGCESDCELGCESVGCQAACELDGCQTGAEWGDSGGCGSCETSCQQWCQLDCESGDEFACGGSCESASCECACESACEYDCETGSETAIGTCSFCGYRGVVVTIANVPGCGSSAAGTHVLPYVSTSGSGSTESCWYKKILSTHPNGQTKEELSLVVREVGSDPDWPSGNYVRHPAWVDIFDSDGNRTDYWVVDYNANKISAEADWTGVGGMLCGDTGTVQYSPTADCWVDHYWMSDAAYYYSRQAGTACDEEPSPCPTVTIQGWLA